MPVKFLHFSFIIKAFKSGGGDQVMQNCVAQVFHINELISLVNTERQVMHIFHF